MQQIAIDFDVYKELTYRRQSEAEDYNDVLRKLLKLPVKRKSMDEPTGGQSWFSEGVEFPHGTEFRGKRLGTLYTATVDDGKLVADGESFDSLSPAAAHFLGYNQNGWTF